ncbi:hypothetical protein V6N13_121608 [Hibiscus sabdariffa]
MQNPISAGLCAKEVSAAGFQGGRPPDGTVCFDDSEVLERPGSPILSGFQPVKKKGRRVDVRLSDEMMVVDEESQGKLHTEGESNLACGLGIGDQNLPMPSFKDMLIGDKEHVKRNKEINDLDVEVREEDVREACGKEDVVVENTEAVEEVKRDLKDLYGPWMQVVNRGRRPAGNRGFGASNVGRGRGGVKSGSRFMVLEEDMGPDEGTVDAAQVEDENRGQVALVKAGNGSNGVVAEPMPDSVGSPRRVNAGDEAGSSMVQRQAGGGVDNDELRVVENTGQGFLVDVAASGTVVGAKTTLDSGKHVVVRVEERVESGGLKLSKGRVLPNSIRGTAPSIKKGGGTQGGPKLGVKIAKRDERPHANPRLTSCLSSLVSDLDRAAEVEKARLTETWMDSSSRMGGKDPTPDTGNGEQGALDPEFNKIFKFMMKDKKPDVVAIFEPRISGRRADNFIRSSGFECSFRVEATGFSGGIWVLWRNTISLDILAVSNQCSMIFDVEFSEHDGLLHRGLRLIIECEQVFGLTEQACATEVRNPLRWCGPATGWVKLNVDAAVNSADGMRWVSRERNGVVDSLAAMGRLHGRSGVGFRLPPGGVLDRLDKERIEWLAAERRTALPSSRVRDSGIVFDPGG